MKFLCIWIIGSREEEILCTSLYKPM